MPSQIDGESWRACSVSLASRRQPPTALPVVNLVDLVDLAGKDDPNEKLNKDASSRRPGYAMIDIWQRPNPGPGARMAVIWASFGSYHRLTGGAGELILARSDLNGWMWQCLQQSPELAGVSRDNCLSLSPTMTCQLSVSSVATDNGCTELYLFITQEFS